MRKKDGKANGDIMMVAQTRWAQFSRRRGALAAASTVTWRGNAQRKGVNKADSKATTAKERASAEKDGKVD